MTKKIPCIVFLAIFKDNATFFRRGSFITRQTCAYAKQKKKCVFPVTDRPQALAIDPNFFFGFVFLQLILLAEKCFQFQVYFCCNLY